MTLSRLATAIELTMVALAAIDQRQSAWRLILARDRIVWHEMSAEERRLFFVWADQEQPS